MPSSVQMSLASCGLEFPVKTLISFPCAIMFCPPISSAQSGPAAVCAASRFYFFGSGCPHKARAGRSSLLRRPPPAGTARRVRQRCRVHYSILSGFFPPDKMKIFKLGQKARFSPQHRPILGFCPGLSPSKIRSSPQWASRPGGGAAWRGDRCGTPPARRRWCPPGPPATPPGTGAGPRPGATCGTG